MDFHELRRAALELAIKRHSILGAGDPEILKTAALFEKYLLNGMDTALAVGSGVGQDGSQPERMRV